MKNNTAKFIHKNSPFSSLLCSTCIEKYLRTFQNPSIFAFKF